MAVPVVDRVSHDRGPAVGGDVVRLSGRDFEPEVSVTFGGLAGEVLRVVESGPQTFADVRTPAHDPGLVDIELRNLDGNGDPVPTETVVIVGAYEFARSALATEADLTRLVRQLLQDLKRQILENVSISVSADYVPDEEGDGGLEIASLPALVLSGPNMEESREYSTNELQEVLLVGPQGPEVVRRRPPMTVDLAFRITGASENTVELLNLMAATGTFLHRTRWVTLDRDAADPAAGSVRWELAPTGEFRTRMSRSDGVRVFTGSFVVRGFDLEDARALDFSRPVERHEETFVEVTDP